jgi:hypothetical protein
MVLTGFFTAFHLDLLWVEFCSFLMSIYLILGLGYFDEKLGLNKAKTLGLLHDGVAIVILLISIILLL